MKKSFYYAVGLLLCGLPVQAQIAPLPNAVLNYTQIMFEYESIPEAKEYIIQVVQDTTGSSFTKPLVTKRDSSTATLLEGFDFGKKYVWRYRNSDPKAKGPWRGPFHFEIMDAPSVQDNVLRLRVIKNIPSKTAGGILWMDHALCAVNREGKPIWFLPSMSQRDKLQDLKMSPTGSVTFLTRSRLLDCTLDGTPLWEKTTTARSFDKRSDVSPKSKSGIFHHDFRKLPNGNYMVLSDTTLWRKSGSVHNMTSSIDRDEPTEMREDGQYTQMLFETIVEYDTTGNVVWRWSPEKYLQDTDLYAIKADQHPLTPGHRAHLNAFSIDATGEYIYAGFRNLNRVVKIRKQTGQVIYSWGDKMPSGDAKEGDGFFCSQHDANLLHDGSLAVFNNGDIRLVDSPSSIVIFTQPSQGEKSKIAWKYDCTFMHDQSDKSVKFGNVEELPNYNLLVCMGETNRVFEITRQKEIVWNALIESKEENDSVWKPNPLYRAHYSSSLFPYYFTIQSSIESLLDNHKACSLKIFNEGTENDSYSIAVTSGDLKREITTPIIASGKSSEVKINLDYVISANDVIQLKVVSKTNPQMEKKLEVR